METVEACFRVVGETAEAVLGLFWFFLLIAFLISLVL